MKAHHVRVVMVLLLALMAAACSNSSSAVPPEYGGLKIEFTPVCVEGEIKLRGEIFNAGSDSVQIESGALPWQYDLLGTDFQAESEGKPLAKNATTPLIGKTGPKVLRPNERRQGFAPIEFIFPQLKTVLATRSVIVMWTYPLTAQSRGAGNQARGRIEITTDPCKR